MKEGREMNRFGLEFHHLGLAVRRPDDAVRFLDGLGYEIGEPIFDPEQNINAILCRHGGAMPDVEITVGVKSGWVAGDLRGMQAIAFIVAVIVQGMRVGITGGEG